ncbi:MAG: hypothetical protein AAGC96_00485 [Pseudomonadota bacterium]
MKLGIMCMWIKARLIDFTVVLSLVLVAPAIALSVQNTALETPLRVAVGEGRLLTDRIQADITIDGQPYDRGVAFKTRRNGHLVYLIYFETQDEPWNYAVLNILPEEKMAGFSANTPPYGAMSIADRVLLQSELTYKFTPLDMSIKSGLVDADFRVIDENTFEFTVLTPCAKARSLRPPPDLATAAFPCPPTTYGGALPLGKWRVEVNPE